MTTPLLMTAAPVAPAGPAGADTGGSAESAATFSTALDDALTGSTDAGGRRTGTADDEPPADEPGSDDAATAPAVAIQPGLWALLNVALPVSTPLPTTPTTAPATPVEAAAASPTPILAATVPAAAAPDASTAPPAPAQATPLPTALAVAGPTGATPAAEAPIEPAPVATPPTVLPTSAPTVAPPQAEPAGPALTVVTAAPATAAPAPVPADGGAAAPVVTDVLLTGASRDTSDAGGTGADGRTGGQGTGSPAAPAPAPAFDVDGLVAPPAPAPAAPAAAPSAPPATPLSGDGPPVAAQLGRQLAVLTNAPDGTHTMTLVITPDDLGPVAIQATVTNGTLDLSLHGAHEHGRHALKEALPELRRDLETAGLSVNRLEVGADSGRDGSPWARSAQQQLADSQAGRGRPGQAEASRSWAQTGDQPGAGDAARAPHLSTSSGVDVLA